MVNNEKEIDLTPEELRKLQLVQLEILTELDRVCRENDIKYSIDGGTLLGAVRHNGFIPWDDDIDVIMLREEYEKFFKVCSSALDKDRFFLQEARTDKYHRNGFSRLRRNGSIFARFGHAHINYHKGIFIDIFVLDNVPDGKVKRILHKAACFVIRKTLWSKSAKKLHPSKLKRLWYSVLSLVPRDFSFFLLDKVSKKYNKKETELVSHLTHPYPNEEKCKYGIPRRFLNDFTELLFEGKKFMAVREYDEYLTMLYNDYMKLPPEEKRRRHIPISDFAVPTEFN